MTLPLRIKSITPADITAVVLCGGRATRMGGMDKGLQIFHQKPLVWHAITRLLPQVSQIVINANRNLESYRMLGKTVVTDKDSGYIGPLAGFAAALSICQTPYLLTVPCDSPRFPLDLAQRLASEICNSQADLAIAAQRMRTEPVFCLIRCDFLTNLQIFLQKGGRKIDAWTAQHHTIIVNFDRETDDPQAFMNINTLEELSQLNYLTST